MTTTYVTHTNGNDNNGGGYTHNFKGTWEQWRDNSFRPVAVVSSGDNIYVSEGLEGRVRILYNVENPSIDNPSDIGSGILVGVIAKVVFPDPAIYGAGGRYEILFADDNYIDIKLNYIAPTRVECRIGGALLKIKSMVDLLVTNNDDIGKVCGGSTHAVAYDDRISDDHDTIKFSIEGVDLDTGLILPLDDKTNWPIIQASGAWATAVPLFYLLGGLSSGAANAVNCSLKRLKFDCNNIDNAQYGLQAGDVNTTYVGISCYGVDVKNVSKSDGYAFYQVANGQATPYGSKLSNLTIINCYNGFSTTKCISVSGDINIVGRGGVGYGLLRPSSIWTTIAVEHLDISKFDYAIYESSASTGCPSIKVFLRAILHDNNYGIYSGGALTAATDFTSVISNVTFANNASGDVYIKAADGAGIIELFLNNVLFYTAAGQDTFYFERPARMRIYENAAAFNMSGGDRYTSGKTIAFTDNVQTLIVDPFVDSTNTNVSLRDYRLNPNSSDFYKLYDYSTGTQIGALGPAKLNIGRFGSNQSRW